MKIKVHESYRKVVALCDSDILGKKFEEGKKILDVRENFFNGEEVDFSKAVEMLKKYAKDDATFNIFGEEAVKAAMHSGLIDEGSIGNVGGVPFALVLL